MLDTNAGVMMRRKNQKFKNVVAQKINDFKTEHITNEMKKYLDGLEHNKTFLNKKKNFLNQLKIYMIFRNYLLKTYYRVKEIREQREKVEKEKYSCVIM